MTDDNQDSALRRNLKALLAAGRFRSQRALSLAAGLNESAVKNILTGKSHHPRHDTVERLAAAAGVSATELLGGIVAHVGNTPDLPPVISDLPGYVPVVGVMRPAEMGGGGGDPDPFYDELETLYFRERLIRHELRAKPDDIKFFDVRGQSMTPVLEHGDEVLIDTRDTNPAEPGLFVLWDGDGIVCKWVQIVHQSDPPRLKVSSENERFDHHEPLAEQCRVFGRVVWYARRL